MPFPRSITRINKRVVNPVLGKLAGRVGAFAWVEHAGRTSGKLYRTPIMAFRQGDTVTMALTYGPATDWVKNVQAAGRASVTLKGETLSLIDPALMEGEPRSFPYPAPVALFLRVMGVRHALRMRVERYQPT